MARQRSINDSPGQWQRTALPGTESVEAECEAGRTASPDPRAEWWAAPGEEVEGVGVTDGILEQPLMPLRVFMAVIGVGPPAYHPESKSYRMRWLSLSGVATLAATAAVVVLTVVAALGLVWHLLAGGEDPDTRPVRSLKTIGVLIVGGYQVNALVQVLNTAMAEQCHARLLTAWTSLVALHHIDPTRGLRRKCLVQVVFMTVFITGMLASAGLGRPRFVVHVLEGLAERLYLVPRVMMDDPSSPAAKVRPLHSLHNTFSLKNFINDPSSSTLKVSSPINHKHKNYFLLP